MREDENNQEDDEANLGLEELAHDDIASERRADSTSSSIGRSKEKLEWRPQDDEGGDQHHEQDVLDHMNPKG